jgi:predicted RNA binding protein YcfA (HicA-like mRNA interferase family)
MADFGKDVRKALRAAGCFLLRQGRGDHEIWYCPGTKRKLTVDFRIKSRHTANAILKAADLTKKF